jgi:hypothetical protein
MLGCGQNERRDLVPAPVEPPKAPLSDIEIDNGARFIIDDVLTGVTDQSRANNARSLNLVSAHTVSLLQEMEAASFHFFLARAIYIALATKESPIPSF